MNKLRRRVKTAERRISALSPMIRETSGRSRKTLLAKAFAEVRAKRAAQDALQDHQMQVCTILSRCFQEAAQLHCAGKTAQLGALLEIGRRIADSLLKQREPNLALVRTWLTTYAKKYKLGASSPVLRMLRS
jgi:hypothetical protein